MFDDIIDKKQVCGLCGSSDIEITDKLELEYHPFRIEGPKWFVKCCTCSITYYILKRG